MSQESIEIITPETLLDQVKAKRAAGCRLVQISATRLPDQVELTYSFDLKARLTNLRLLADGPRAPRGKHQPDLRLLDSLRKRNP